MSEGTAGTEKTNSNSSFIIESKAKISTSTALEHSSEQKHSKKIPDRSASILHPQDSCTVIYVKGTKPLTLTTDTVVENVTNIENHIVSGTNSNSRRQIEVGSLSQLWSFFLQEGSREQKPSSNTGTALAALDRILNLVSEQLDLASIVCRSLEIALSQQQSSHDQSILSLLKSLIPSNTETGSQGNKEYLDTTSAVTFAVAIHSGRDSLKLPRNSSSVQFAQVYLNELLSDQQLEIELSFALKQVLLSNYLSSEPFQKSPQTFISIIHNIQNMSNKTNNGQLNSSLGMSQQLSPAGQNLGLGLTNLLADLGPSCTTSTSTLRDTIYEIIKSLPLDPSSNISKPTSLDEEAIARLIHFFSERGSRKQNSSSLVQSLADNHGPNGNNWNIAAVQELFAKDYSDLNWDQVAIKFDFNSFIIRDAMHFNLLLTLYKAGAKKDYPSDILVSRWENRAGQVTIIEQALSVSPIVYPFVLSNEESIDASTAGDVSTSTMNTRGLASLGVLQVLLEIADTTNDQGIHGRLHNLFARLYLGCPEVSFCAVARLFAQCKIDNLQNAGRRLLHSLLSELYKHYFYKPTHVNASAASKAIRRVWTIDKNFIIRGCIFGWNFCRNDAPQNLINTVIHLINVIRTYLPENGMSSVLNDNLNQHEFSISIAFVMADNDLLQLREWLNSRISANNGGLPFLIALIEYVGRNVSSAMPRVAANNNNDGKMAPLVSIENMVLTIQRLRVLDASILGKVISGLDSQEQTLGDQIKRLFEKCISTHPSLSSALAHQANNQPSNFGQPNTPSNPDEIEEMANSYFQKIYTSEQSIDEVVNMLKSFKTSGTQKENDIFACMIHNLFDEYRFFSKYPEKELRITGILFGKLIQHQLVSSITLGIALRYVLEALRKPPGPGHGSSTTSSGGKMFRFGMFALEQFKDRLHEWPQYCSHIVNIPHLKEGYRSLVEEIEGALVDTPNRDSSSLSVGSAPADTNSVSSSRPANVPRSVDVKVAQEVKPNQTNALIPGPIIGGNVPVALPPVKKVAKFGPGLGRAVNGKMEDKQHDAPPDTVLDKVQFLINNVTISNVESKSKDLKDLLDPKYFGWLGQYLVVKRISTQPNFHEVYLAFLEHLGDYGKGLIDAILACVYLNVGALLRSPKITTSTTERSLLKNLGSWLGQITLARNKPILQITLDCKELLYQGYETGMLIAVTPFVAKILEGAKNSGVFRPPNPWLMGLLSVFRALYGVDDLKMNIKFEVEVLCKNLGVKLEEIPIRADDLAKRIAPVKTRNPDFNIKSSMANQSQSPAPNSSSGKNSSQGNEGKQGINSVPPSGMNLNTANLQSVTSSSPNSSQDQHQTVIPNLASYVSINSNVLQSFQQLVNSGNAGNLNSSSLKRNVPIAVDRAIREIIQPVVERSVTIACITTKEIVTKDFAMEGDEDKFMKAAQLMVANLAGSLALVTCREPLRASVSTHLRQLLHNGAAGGNGDSAKVQLSEKVQSVLDQCVASCSQDNLELGCMLIEKAATEKAVRDMEEAIAPALQTRKKHREQTGQPFYDMSIFNGNQRYPASLPEPLLPKPGGLRNEQLHVYEAFQRMPRQPAVSSQEQNGSNGPTGTQNPEAQEKGMRFNIEAFTRVAVNLQNSITTLLTSAGHRAPEITLGRLPADHEIRQLLVASKQMASSIATAGNMSSTEQDSILGFAQNIFKRLYELRLSEPLRLEAFVGLLDALNECCQQLSKDIGTWATYAPTETDGQRKLHRTVLLLLLRSNLLQVNELDGYLCDRMDNGRNQIWLEFAIAFIRTALLEKIVNPKDLPKTMNVLSTLSSSGNGNNQIAQLLSLIHEVKGKSSHSEEKGRTTPENVAATVSGLNALVGKPDKPSFQQSSSMSVDSLNNLVGATKRALESIELISARDPSNFTQQVTLLLDGWMRLSNEADSKKTFQYVQLLQQNGIGKNEEQTERFFRVSTEVLVKAVLQSAKLEETKSQGQQVPLKQFNYNVIDDYCKLVSVLVRHLNSGGSSEQIANQRISLLNQILGVTMRTMMADYERSKRDSTPWDQRPWFRLLLNLVMDLNSPSSTLDPISYGILKVFGSAFHVVQPLVIPGFAFAWLELISHRMFLSNLLLLKGQKGWALAHQLLIDLFLFLEPHLCKAKLTDSMKHLYEGTLRVLLVLLHDFPAFLSGYHLSFCNVIPDNCIQLRNLVLSAFSRGMVLPDPFTPNLKIDLLPEISKSPVILSNVVGPLNSIREDLDSFLKTRQPADFLQKLLPRLSRSGTNQVDSPRINSLVLYVGMHAIAKMQNSQTSQSLAHTPEMEIIQKLMDFNDSGRYVSLNAIANQLRYPSSHTHYFSCVMLFLFSEAKDEGVREQVTRVLLERLIVHKPHPWGLLITFIELIKNQRYQFWSHPFTRCATEIENVFERVAKSCLTPGTQRSASIGGDGA